MLIDNIIEQLKSRASEINKCSEGSVWVSINDGKVSCVSVKNDLPVSYKEIPLVPTNSSRNKSAETDSNDEPNDLSERAFDRNLISKDLREQEELKKEESKRSNEIITNKRSFWRELSPHLLNIKCNQTFAIVLKMAGIPEDISAKLLGLEDYRRFEELLYGRRGKNPRGGAIKALIKSAIKSADLSGDIPSLEVGIRKFKTLFRRRYDNFQ